MVKDKRNIYKDGFSYLDMNKQETIKVKPENTRIIKDKPTRKERKEIAFILDNLTYEQQQEREINKEKMCDRCKILSAEIEHESGEILCNCCSSSQISKEDFFIPSEEINEEKEGETMNKYEELSAEIIDDVCEIVELQHPEIKLSTKISKEAGIDNPALICGEQYYNLEQEIAKKIKFLAREAKQ